MNNQLDLVGAEKDKLTDTFNGFSSVWMPLMTLIGTNSFVTEMDAALAKVDGVEADVNTYAAKGGAPPAASALPTALNNVRASIKALRDGVTGDLNNLQTLFTGSLMVVYPTASNDLFMKELDLKKKKTEAAEQVTTSTKEIATQEAAIKQHNSEWDEAQTTCESFLKGEALLLLGLA